MTTKISGDNISVIANTGVNWNAVTVADGSTTLNASAGNGYFLDTNAGVIEVFLPTSPTRGDTVILADYAGTFGTNQIIINTGGVNIDSTIGSEFKVTTNNSIVECVYVDSAKGWLIKLNQAAGTTPTITGNEVSGTYDSDAEYISATGGTVTESGNFKIHSFTGDGCFVVSSVGNPAGSDSVDYLVVAGGGGGAHGQQSNYSSGGGGAGGARMSSGTASGCYTASPLGACVSSIPVSVTTYPVTVGAGGAAGCSGNTGISSCNNTPGSNSVFSTITSTGGGRGGNNNFGGATGGSGGGGSGAGSGGSGNTPPTSPSQGNNGGTGCGSYSSGRNNGGGGGGAGGTGETGSNGCGCAGGGGLGITNAITGSSVGYAGGGVGSASSCCQAVPFGGGIYNPQTNAVANTGGGGYGGSYSGAIPGGAGGKGVVILRYKYQ